MKKYNTNALAIFTIVLLAMPLMAAVPQKLPIPERTRILIQLNSGISSKTNRVGDRFTATVISPLEYEGATVRGHISQLKESGRVKGKTEMTLDFDVIELRNGRSSPLNVELLEVRQSESVKVVDEEGRVETGSRGKQSIKRGAIGAAIGGVLGGLIGGGKGALIGILVGGGAGAGSLIVDGEKELRLESGTEMDLRALKTSASETESFRPTRRLIMDAQSQLNEQGYEAGSVDGLMGPQTRSAIARFQRDNGLAETGRLDRETAEKLGIIR